ncbi:hypothetical protein Daus18300_001094 [Diaporthe australafricana]|uniref:Uncharacterized protein n=1 Tax=Diaporthe australafricana TaxID=127596 RepID=A0ABR3Y026_9PEZI
MTDNNAISPYVTGLLDAANPTVTPDAPAPDPPRNTSSGSTKSAGPSAPKSAGPSAPPAPTTPVAPAAPTTPPPSSGPLNLGALASTLGSPPGPGALSKSAAPARPPPRAKTPERRTAPVGIQKVSPIRRARPDEGQPRRPQIDRAAHRRLLREAARPALVVPAPTDAPAPEVAWPRIPLPAASYETARLLMTTSRERRPGTIPWTDVLNLFRDIGFVEGPGRNSRGGIQVFSPSAALRQSQGITQDISKDRPHGANVSTLNARHFVTGEWGFGKYGWEFDKFIQAP